MDFILFLEVSRRPFPLMVVSRGYLFSMNQFVIVVINLLVGSLLRQSFAIFFNHMCTPKYSFTLCTHLFLDTNASETLAALIVLAVWCSGELTCVYTSC